jgi:hypothetical protein
MIQSVGNFAFSRDSRCVALQVFITEISRSKTYPVSFEAGFLFQEGNSKPKNSKPKWPDACMKVAEAESDKDGVGLYR